MAKAFFLKDFPKKELSNPRILSRIPFWIVLLLLCQAQTGYAQYFGRNKPRYRNFDFEVLQSPHFEIYHYLQSDSTVQALASLHELWFNKHQEVFKDTFDARNPIVIYNHHAEFQQTTTIPNYIGIGTGGVTEGIKNRVIFPLLETNSQTSHVIGHELVHAFQFNMLKSGDSTSLGSIRNLPLWMVEGLAEYLSIGRVDAHTAMWMRDALLNDRFPTLDDLTTNPSYFPYRYGQAFWAFVTGIWGEEVIAPLYSSTAKYGYHAAMDSVLKLRPEEISSLWKTAMERHYNPLMKDTMAVAGERLLPSGESGSINISPVYSPDAKYIAFISEKDVLSIDIHLMELSSGRVVRKLSGAAEAAHIDDFNYIESVGTFSPDNSLFAYTVVSKGRNYLAVVDVESGKTVQNISMPGLPVFNNPSWSPDGRYILMSGLVEGQSDLYLYDYHAQKLERLTHDPYSDIHASWSSDGKTIVFASDRGKDTDFRNFRFGSFRLCLLEVQTGSIEVLDIFPGADNLHPHFSPDNRRLFFLSDADGFRNLYEHDLETATTYRRTKYFTGISGITKFSPALTVARNNKALAYSLYRDGKYTIYRTDTDDPDFVREKMDARQANVLAATLPPAGEYGDQQNKQYFDPLQVEQLRARAPRFDEVPLKPRFQLDYIGNHTIGVAAGRFGTGLTGGINALFSDILGTQTLFGAFALNGEIYDLGGQLAYLNQKRIFQWGASLSYVPYRSAALSYFPDEINYGDTTLQVLHEALDILRTYEAQGSLFAYYPFSTQRRVEATASFARYHHRLDRLSNYYYQGIFAGAERKKLPVPEGFNLARLEAAFVEDNATFGLVGPLDGRRLRLSAEQFLGAADFRAYLGDYRQYFRMRPFSFALRLYHYGRYGNTEDSELLPPLFLGFPTHIRGYSGNSFSRNSSIETGGFNINQLMGSRIFVSNAELRLPFTGPERLSLINFNLLPSELALFVDGGIAWDSKGYVNPEVSNVANIDRKPVFSGGLSLRVNVLGYLVVEPYYAVPLQRNFEGGEFGVNFVPAW